MRSRMVILRAPQSVDLDVLKQPNDELTAKQRLRKQALMAMDATWLRMPGMGIFENKRLWQLRVDGKPSQFNAFLAEHAPAWELLRMRKIHKQLIADGEGKPVLDGGGNRQYEIVRDHMTPTSDAVIRAHMIPGETPYAGRVRLSHLDTQTERDNPEYVDFGT